MPESKPHSTLADLRLAIVEGLNVGPVPETRREREQLDAAHDAVQRLFEQLEAAQRVVRIVAEKGFADLDDELYDAMKAILNRDEQSPAKEEV